MHNYGYIYPCPYMVLPKIRGTSLGVPIIRTKVFWGLHWGRLNLGTDHVLHYIHSNVHDGKSKMTSSSNLYCHSHENYFHPENMSPASCDFSIQKEFASGE